MTKIALRLINDEHDHFYAVLDKRYTGDKKYGPGALFRLAVKEIVDMQESGFDESLHKLQEEIECVSQEGKDPLTALRAHLAACAPLLAVLKPGDDATARASQEWQALADAVERAVSYAGNLSK